MSIDSSTSEWPVTTVASRGIVSPGRTRIERADRDALGRHELARVVFRTARRPVRSEDGARAASASHASPGSCACCSIALPVARIEMISGAITPCSRAAKAPPPPRWTWRPPRAIASTALTASAARVPTTMSVSMLVAP